MQKPTLTSWGLRDGRLPRKLKLGAWQLLNRAGFLQRPIGTVLVNRFQPTRGNSHPNKLLQFRDPDAVFMQVWIEQPRHVLGNVTADAALLLRHTAAMNDAPTRGACSCNLANL